MDCTPVRGDGSSDERWLRYDEAEALTVAKGCKVDGCERQYHANGYCNLHYQREKKGVSFDAPAMIFRVGCLVMGC